MKEMIFNWIVEHREAIGGYIGLMIWEAFCGGQNRFFKPNSTIGLIWSITKSIILFLADKIRGNKPL